MKIKAKIAMGNGKKWPRTVALYAFAVVVVALATGMRLWLEKAFGPMPLFVTFYPAVALVATVAGGGPGIVATLLSAMAADYWSIEPVGSFGAFKTNDAVAMGIFAGTGILLSAMIKYYRRVREKSIEAMRLANNYNRSLLEASLDPLVTISADGKVTDVNEATIKATGRTRQELIGTDFTYYFTEPEKARQGYRQVFEKGFITDYPLTIRHKDGKLTEVLYNASVYKDTRGNVMGIFAAARDVTLLKQAEAELKHYHDHLELVVKQRTSDLEATNRELTLSNENLEQFAYVASHDLQEPLRMMASYSELLERRYKSKLDTDADEFISYIVDGAKRMQKLINDLLAYSRIGRSDKPLEEIDCNAILNRVVGSMDDMAKSTGALITQDKLPVLMGNESNFIQLFQNLVGNAIKFHGPEAPRVHVGAAKGSDRWLFSIKDNGIGIEPQYQERVFLIFQRLHGRDKYPGTGIGLSICKKIVETQGGNIWFESEQGKGSTFYFTVPMKGEAKNE
jgi:PAS domain S-box-containing protein